MVENSRDILDNQQINFILFFNLNFPSLLFPQVNAQAENTVNLIRQSEIF